MTPRSVYEAPVKSAAATKTAALNETAKGADPAAALQAAQAASAAAEARIAQLAAERLAKVEAEGDGYLVEVVKIEREIAVLRANCAVYNQRMEAMQAKHRLQVLARREQEKTAGIATVRKRLGKRHDAALRLDVALAQLSAAFAELEAADIAAFTNWPASLPSPHRYFRAETIEPLSTRRSQRMMAGPLRELVTRAPYDLAAAVLKRNVELTTELETAGLPALPAEDLVA